MQRTTEEEKKKTGEQDPSSLGTRMSERAREETQAHKNNGREQKETLDEKLDRIFQDNQVETPQRDRPGIDSWFISIVLFWYWWKYRTTFGLCLFLWSFISDLLWLYGL